jgi:hypothetical protein
MSREVIGDAPTETSRRLVDVLGTSRQALLPQPRLPDVLDDEPAPSRRTPILAALAAVLLLAATWATYAATDPPSDPARGVAAALTGSSSAFSTQTTRRVLLSITVTNPGREPVNVVGYAPTTRSSAAAGLDDPSAYVAAGGKVEVTVDVSLDCARAAPLLLPDLLIQEQDGGRRAIPAVGSVAALTSLCAEGPAAAQPLTVTGVRREEAVLVVAVAAPSNRRTEIRSMTAGGFGTDAAPLPVTVGREGAELRIRPPAECPRPWREDGVPTSLTLEVESAGPSVVHLTVGKPLVQWALDVVCVTP